MPRISLTDFVDVVSASGTPKATKVRQIKKRPEYHPALDFYKRLREEIAGTHKNGAGKGELNSITQNLPDQRKMENYLAVIDGYKKWWGNKDIEWFDPPGSVYSAHGIDVSVNPELGLEFNGSRHCIKLYFKADKLTKNRIDIVTHTMAVALEGVAQETIMSVMDTRRGRIISPTVPIVGLDATLRAELAYIAALWNE